MNIESLRQYCLSLPHTKEDVKWGADLCFTIASKMYCVAGIESPMKVSFKCSDQDFDLLIERPGIVPAPYMARNKWAMVEKASSLTITEWEHYIKQSYFLIISKLPKKTIKELSMP